MNIRGVNSTVKQSQLIQLMNSIENLDIVALTETKLTKLFRI
jgi:exonuclease III